MLLHRASAFSECCNMPRFADELTSQAAIEVKDHSPRCIGQGPLET